MTQKYKCLNCGWIGTEDQMDCDYTGGLPSEEYWSNWICPGCFRWFSGTYEYEEVNDANNAT